MDSGPPDWMPIGGKEVYQPPRDKRLFVACHRGFGLTNKIAWLPDEDDLQDGQDRDAWVFEDRTQGWIVTHWRYLPSPP